MPEFLCGGSAEVLWEDNLCDSVGIHYRYLLRVIAQSRIKGGEAQQALSFIIHDKVTFQEREVIT